MAWLMITARFKVPGIVLLTILGSLSHCQSEQPNFITNPAYSGSCKSIDYSAKCCPPGETCKASDGDCSCKADCHDEDFNDCCDDVFCHPSNNNFIILYVLIYLIISILQSQEHAKILDVAITHQNQRAIGFQLGAILNILSSMMKMDI